MDGLVGIVQMKPTGSVYLCEDYDAVRLNNDPWQELDGPLWPEHRKREHDSDN